MAKSNSKTRKLMNDSSSSKVTIGENDIGGGTAASGPKYLCNKCDGPLTKVTDEEYHCDTCCMTTLPNIEDVRTAQDIELPQGPAAEPVVSCPDTPGLKDVSIHNQEFDLKSGFKVLASKGNIRFTSYSETSG